MEEDTNEVDPLAVRLTRVLRRIGQWAVVIVAVGSVLSGAVAIYDVAYGTGSLLEVKDAALNALLITVDVVLFVYAPTAILHHLNKSRHQKGDSKHTVENGRPVEPFPIRLSNAFRIAQRSTWATSGHGVSASRLKTLNWKACSAPTRC